MGINCLLVSTNQVVVPYPVYPLGLAHLTGALEAAGHRVIQFDLLAQGGLPGLERVLASFSPDLIGVSIRNLDTVDSTSPDSFLTGTSAAMSGIRKLSDAPVVLGGPAFSILPAELLDLLQADYGIAGEGEELLLWLAHSIEEGTPPAKGLFRASPSDAWPAPSYSRETAEFYLSWGGMLNIQTKRGCPYRCGYCSYPAIEGRQLRFRDPESVAEEVTRVTRELGTSFSPIRCSMTRRVTTCR
jgi:lipid biosynthesis B12-binding/radical SAM protein